MSQQGPGGGYGSGQGGAPPGPGGYGPPGGYGGPPGGYGGPPGGYGPPGYGPPGAAMPPHYGPPQGHPAPAGPPPKKKSNALLFVGLGCLVLLIAGVAAGVFFFLKAKSKYDEIAAGVAPALGSASPGAASGACAKAAACCRAVMQKTPGASAEALKACESFGAPGLPEVSCQQALDGYRKTSGFLGVNCD